MIDIGKSNFLINVTSLPGDEFERYSSTLFDQWDAYVEHSLKIPDYSISLEVEEGSIKGIGKIAAAVSALYVGIGMYGDFISGLQTIQGQVSYLGNKLHEIAVSPFEGDHPKTTVRNNGGVVSQLQRLFHKVQAGEITAEQAYERAEKIIGHEAYTSQWTRNCSSISTTDYPYR